MAWVIRAHGTAAFLAIDLGAGAPGTVLVLPSVAALASLAIAALVLRHAAFPRPEREDWWILGLNLGLFGVAVLVLRGAPAPTADQPIALVFLLLASFGQLPASWPMLRTAWAYPTRERPHAWFVWAIAYAMMLAATMQADLAWPYLVYPGLNLGIHLALGCLALSTPRNATRGA